MQSCLKRSGNLGRMVCIIIDNDSTIVEFSLVLKAAISTGESSESFFNGFIGDPHGTKNCHSCKRIANIMMTGNMKMDSAKSFTECDGNEGRIPKCIVFDIDRIVVFPICKSISNHLAVKAVRDLLYVRDLTVNNEKTIL